MADFCKQCSMEIFGEDFKELAGLGSGVPLPPDHGWQALCEGCGPALVLDDGTCISRYCDKKHGVKPDESPTSETES